ncbi:MAG: polysaccharide deacetylase family protein, partial [Acidimicrobiia bacterium]
PPPPGSTFTQPLVSLTFDDGWISHATAALPALQAHGKTGTFYVLSGEINVDPYMSAAQILSLKNAGMEIGSHTISHPHLPQLSSAQQDAELQQSRATLEALIGEPVPNFCSPYGEYDANVLTKIKAVYGSHRTVNEGVNTKANTDPYQLLVRNVYNTTTRAEVEGWLAEAKAQNGWVILVFHNIVANPDTYDSSPAMFEQYLQAVDQSGITVKTIAGALAEVRPQLA